MKTLKLFLREQTRQKGLQIKSGPMCFFVFVCWHRGEAMQTGYQREKSSYNGELLTARTAVKTAAVPNTANNFASQDTFT